MAEGLSAFAKKRKSRKIRRYVFLGILVALLLGTALYFSLENYFVVRKVSVEKSAIYATEDIVKTANIKKKTPLYRLNTKKIAKKIQDKFPYVYDVKVSFKLPTGVQITFEEEYGEMALALGNEVYAVDRNLLVLAKEGKDTTIPRIYLECVDVKRCVVGEQLTFENPGVGPSLLELMEALEAEDMLSHITAIDVSDKFNLKMTYENRFVVLLGDRQDMKLKLMMVGEVVADLGEKTSGRIDISDPNNAYVKLED